MKHTKRVLAIGIALLMMVCLSQPVFGGLNDLIIEDDDGVKSEETSYDLVAQNDALELYVGKDTATVRVKDKRNNAVWDNTVNVTEEEISSSYVRENLYAPIVLNYVDIDSLEMAILEVYSTEAAMVEMTPQENGADARFDFKKLGIVVTVKYRLEGDNLVVSVPADGIQETTSNKIVTIKVLPLFGAAHTTDKGYVFYPDGSGAISAFSERYVTYYTNFVSDVYGENMKYLFQGDNAKELSDIYMPVFGMVKNGYGFFGSIEKGEEDSRIYYDPSGYHYHLYRTYGELVYRRPYTATLASGRVQSMVEKFGIYTDRQLRYTFLEQTNATYSDIANRYRQQLIDGGQLGTSQLIGQTPLLLELFNGVIEEQVLMNKYISMTTLDEAESILRELTEAGVDDMLVSLLGWSADGYGALPAATDVASAIGGASGLKSFTSMAEELGVPVLLGKNYLQADKKTGTISMNDVVYAPDGLRPYTNMDTGSNRYFFSLDKIRKSYSADSKKFKSWGIDGLSYEALGSTLYYDNKEADGAVRKAHCVSVWQQLLEKSRESYGLAMVQGGNQYALGQADWISGLAEQDSGYLFATETVPFYQMVVHGRIPYSGSAINLFYDETEQLLHQIEYGYMPLYRLTAQSPDQMMDSRYTLLFSSEYSLYKDKVLETYEMWKKDFAALSDQAMVYHEKLTASVSKTVYENGTSVYVNYADEAVEIDGVTVPAGSYTVKGGSQ